MWGLAASHNGKVAPVLAQAQAVLPAVVYGSSSSVYGLNSKVPGLESDLVNQPASLAAATMRVGLGPALTFLFWSIAMCIHGWAKLA